MMTNRTGLHSVLLPLFIEITSSYKYGFPKGSHRIKMYETSTKIIEYVKDLKETKRAHLKIFSFVDCLIVWLRELKYFIA